MSKPESKRKPEARSRPPARPQDKAYKLIFSYPEMVRDLLRGYVDEPWVAGPALAILVGIEAARDPDELVPLLKALFALLPAKLRRGLGRAFTTWVNQVITARAPTEDNPPRFRHFESWA